MEEGIVSQRYALALFSLIQERNDDPLEIYEKLKVIPEIISSPEVKNFFHNPRTDKKKKEEVFSSVVKELNLSEYINNFFKVMIKKNRLPILSNILKEFEKIMEEKQNIMKVFLYTAKEINSEYIERIKQKLEEATEKKIILEVKYMPELLAGIRLQIGHKVIDGTLRNKIEKIGQQILGA